MSVATTSLIDDDYQEEEEEEEVERDDEHAPASISSSATYGPTKQESIRPLIKPYSKMNLREKLAFVVAWITFILAFSAMIVEGSKFALASWILSMIMGPYLYYQKVTLTNMVVMKETKNSLERDVSRLKGESTRLSYIVDELDGRVEDLLDVEDALEIISNSDGQSVDVLKQQIKTNTEKLEQMDWSVQGRVIETLVSLIYQESNTNSSEEDVATIIRNLNDVPGLYINEDRLLHTLDRGNPIGETIIDVLQNLLDEEISAKKSIFGVVPKRS
jgi:hypothetical protein